MFVGNGPIEWATDARQRIARHLAELHRLHLALAEDARALKFFTNDGRSSLEIEIATEMLEQYLNATGAFGENMRGRFESRLALLRRGEPMASGGRTDLAPGHGAFWLGFSRLCVVLRRVEQQLKA
jgi:hypothetical protein